MRGPRTWRSIAAIAGAAVCGVSLSSASAASARTREGAATNADPASALLTEADLAADAEYMQIVEGEAAAPPATASGGVCGGPTLTALAQDAGGDVAASRVFVNRQTTDGPQLTETVYSFVSPSAAKKFVASSAKQVDRCTTSWSTTVIPGDAPYEWTIKRQKLATGGTPRFASRQISTSAPDDITRDPDLPSVIETAVVRLGNQVVVLARAGISEAVDLKKTALDDDTKLALRKLKATQ